MDSTPSANRAHIAFFGLRNAGKSTLVNAFCNQQIAIVSDVAGTTTDPVSKAMEILPLGPCLVTDTAGLDDEGELGAMRVEKTLKVLESTDIAVWVRNAEALSDERTLKNEELWKNRFLDACQRRKVTVLEYGRGDSVEAIKEKIAAIKLEEDPGLLDGLVSDGDRVTLVCPIDESAPKGRMILPQVQVLRAALDRHCIVRVCQVEEFTDDGSLTITDSQAFGRIKAANLTSFSILFARQKGDLEELRRGLDAVKALKDGDRVLIAEACTHHRQCNDIGSTKIPKAVTKLSGGKKLEFAFASGKEFDLAPDGKPVALVVHCGGCMLNRRAMLSRIDRCRNAGVPIVNYGLLLHAVLSKSALASGEAAQ